MIDQNQTARGLGLLVLAAAVLVAAPAASGEGNKDPLIRDLAGAIVDWEAGTVTVEARVAADLRMPGTDVARAAARRVAHQRAVDTLTDALRALPLGGGRKLSPAAARQAAARAETTGEEPQSNGGIILKLGVDFSTLGERSASDSEVSIAVPSMPLSVAPQIVIGGQGKTPHTLGSAVYRVGRPPAGGNVLSATKDRAGRLVLKVPAAEVARLQGARAVIFVRTLPKR